MKVVKIKNKIFFLLEKNFNFKIIVKEIIAKITGKDDGLVPNSIKITKKISV